MRATLPQVAARAGVSLSSASRALNGIGASPTMVERVQAAAEELGYRPDATGRSLRTRRTFQVAFAVADIGNPVYVEMMSALQDVLVGEGYRLVVATTGDSAASTATLVRDLGNGFVDGLVLSPLRIDDALLAELAAAPMPVVVIGRPLQEHGLSSVSTDSVAGIGQAVAHALSLGRRRIGFLNGPEDTTPGTARRRGFDSAVAAAGRAVEVCDAETAEDFTVAAGRAAAAALLGRHEEPALDAVVAANDLLAIGAIQAARDAGLTVPADLAVTGMDDTELGRVYQPRLTSVSLGAGERGRLAAELMLDRLAGGDGLPRNLTVEPVLHVRESTQEAS